MAALAINHRVTRIVFHTRDVDGPYLRQGTTTRFAALKVFAGEVFASYKLQHRHQEFLALLREIEAQVPVELDIHMVVDNYATHKHPKVKAWMAARPASHPASGTAATILTEPE